MTVATIDDHATEQTRCNLKNEEGSWTTPPHSVTKIHRDGNAMKIQCENDAQVGKQSVTPEFDGSYLGLDLLLDLCLISCIVDGARDAFYEYPVFVTVPMKDKDTSTNIKGESPDLSPSLQ
ncbi:MAG: hypothetical protein PHE55_19640 [Methylococcaceae bacterium]|nr:hypothetical protein [Methylococcaceae bacterium]